MPIRLVFGQSESALIPARGEIHLANPLLLGSGQECISSGAPDVFEQSAGHFVSESGGWLTAAFCEPVGDCVATTTRRVYQKLFESMADCQIVRAWNFVPAINEEVDGLENYRAFSLGRHEAFHARFGGRAAEAFCAASGVGVDGDRLVIVALGTHRRVRHQENPLQSPAYQYPSQYGPRPPSFSRASFVPGECPALFISGTAAVRGHESVAPGDLAGQLEVTGENLDRIIAESVAALGEDIARVGMANGRAYVRRAEDADAVMAWIHEHAWCADDRVNVVQSDICRRELLVEIELSWPAALD